MDYLLDVRSHFFRCAHFFPFFIHFGRIVLALLKTALLSALPYNAIHNQIPA